MDRVLWLVELTYEFNQVCMAIFYAYDNYGGLDRKDEAMLELIEYQMNSS